MVEQLAIDRAKELFGAEHANVQPHAGATANMAVFGAFLQPKDPCVDRARDGARARRAPDARLPGERVGDVVQLRRLRGRPRHASSSTWTGSATSRSSIARGSCSPATRRTRGRSTSRRSGQIADEVGALLWVDAAHFIGLVAGGAFPSPVPARRRRDVHDAQGAPRPPRRHDPVQAGAREGDRQGGVPDDAGWTDREQHRGQGRGAQGGDEPTTSRPTRSARCATRGRSPPGLADEGLRHRLGRHGLPPGARRRPAARR